MKKSLIILMICLMGCAACHNNISKLKINDVAFEIKPHIVKKSGLYYMKYKISIREDEYQTRWELGFKIMDENAYYFFVGKSSFKEHSEYVEVPLDKDGLSEYATNNSIYWLNPDKTEEKLEIVNIK